jgi:hypothetical protein
MSWGAQNRSKDAKTPSVAGGRSENPEPDPCPIQPYFLVGTNTKRSAMRIRTQEKYDRAAKSKPPSENILAQPIISVQSDYFSIDGVYYGLGSKGYCVRVACRQWYSLAQSYCAKWMPSRLWTRD